MADGGGSRRAAQVLARALVLNGIDHLFCVAGESFLALLDAAYDERHALRLVTCRHEAGAGNMAEAWGKMTGRPGVAVVTRGPGACHASIAVHTAFQDSTPMLLLVGQVPRGHSGREAFQEVDYRHMFGPLAKWVTELDAPDRVPELITRAIRATISGRPGPVVIALPEDVLRAETRVADAPPVTAPAQAAPAPEMLAAVRDRLAASARPAMIVGGSGWTDQSCGAITRFAEANRLPVAVSFRRQHLIDNHRAVYVGDLGTGPNPALIARLRAADLILVVGARLGEITTQGYTLFAGKGPGQTLIHVHAAAEELGRVVTPDLAIQAAPAPFAVAAAALSPVESGGWADWAAAARADYLATLTPVPSGGRLDLGAIMAWLAERLPADAVITSDAGNFALWPQRFLRYRTPFAQLAPTNGAMGYGIPAGVAAALRHPDRLVVTFVGDGGALMTGQELATAVRYQVRPIILVIDNGQFGTIRMHQERHYPGRPSGVGLTNPDFAAWARSFGAFGERVATTGAFAPAFERAVVSGRAAVIAIEHDPEVLVPGRAAAGDRPSVPGPPPPQPPQGGSPLAPHA